MIPWYAAFFIGFAGGCFWAVIAIIIAKLMDR